MFTQCPDCQTVFRVRAAQLRAASGRVRCSQCKHVFNALDVLYETPPSVETPEPKHVDPEPFRDPNTPGDLFEDMSLTETGEFELRHKDDEAPKTVPWRETEPTLPLSDRAEPALGETPVEPGRDDADEAPAIPPPRPVASNAHRPGRGWLLAAFGLGLLLALQVVHAERVRLAAAPGLGPLLRSVYGALDMPIPPRRDPTRLHIIRAQMGSHPTMAGVLELSAMLANEAGFDQPWPVLKVSLEDRFGKTVGQRFFQADAYLADDAAPTFAANSNVVATLEIVDPGQDAVGFHVQPCYPVDHGYACADRPQARTAE